MKTIFTNDMVAHVWAQQKQSDGRTASGNFYFVNETLYSYGSHFIVAKFVEHDGKKAILVNTDTYSNSTNKHQAAARSAIHGTSLTVIYCSFLNSIYGGGGIHESNKQGWLKQIKQSTILAAKARLRSDSHMRDVANYVKQARTYSSFFKLGWRIVEPKLSPKFIADTKAKQKRDSLRLKKRNHDRAVALIKDKAIASVKWLRGEINSFPSSLRDRTNILLRIKGETVETSEGASVPVKDARKLFPLVKLCHDNKKLINTYGDGDNVQVGHFNLRRIEPTGDIQIGCHFIKWAQIERISMSLGL